MTDKELKKLTRAELLEMLIDQTKENELLQEQVAELRQQLDSRSIVISNAGSIADAALQLNGVFAAAEAAGQQYLENIRTQEDLCDRMQQDAERRAARTIEEAEEQARRTLEDAEKKAAQLVSSAQERADSYCDVVLKRISGFYRDQLHIGEPAPAPAHIPYHVPAQDLPVHDTEPQAAYAPAAEKPAYAPAAEKPAYAPAASAPLFGSEPSAEPDRYSGPVTFDDDEL